MLRLIALSLVLICQSLLALADTPPPIAPRPLSSAFDALSGGRWDVAAELARRDGPSAEALVEWYRLRAGHGTPREVLRFLETHADWPGLDYLRKQSEEAMAEAPDALILRFYDGTRPQTGIGALSYTRALLNAGRQGEAEAGLVLAWRTLDLSTEEHETFIARHAALLKPHHAARLDMAQWRGLRDVDLMLPLVDAAKRDRVETARMIDGARRGLDDRIDDLPDETKADPHVAYALFNHYLDRDRGEDAIAVMLEQSRIKGGLGEPGRWAGWRRALARDQMRDDNPQTAYALAATHQLTEGAAYADLEWLSGYLALTYLKDAELARDHFQRFRAAVDTPISLGRAGYWIGRAQEALGDAEAAKLAYAQGADHQTSFYGLLAAEKAGLPSDPALKGENDYAAYEGSELIQRPVTQAAIMALAAGRLNLAERFFTHIAETLDESELKQLVTLLYDLDQPHLQVMVGKRAARRALTLPGPYYALHPMIDMELPVPMELALSIARRESEFDHGVSSRVGAEGLMQLMPGTASDMARELDLDHDRARVLTDWAYNARLGSAYLAHLADRFDGNVVMISAGYNAGPTRPERWIERFGDPRRGGMDVVDWIEHIPFRETRNYVMRVAESLPVYRARLGRDPHPMPFSQELTGATLRAALD
ncbi:lytic transglycosylase domain-containing protein [Roseovarius bejariae]